MTNTERIQALDQQIREMEGFLAHHSTDPKNIAKDLADARDSMAMLLRVEIGHSGPCVNVGDSCSWMCSNCEARRHHGPVGPGPGFPTKQRLEYLRGELRAERISYGEIAELQALAPHIDADDVELLEAAGVPEKTED